MKRITLLTAIAMIGFTVSTFGQSASTQGEASATILTPISISKGKELVFGSIVPDADGTIEILADGSQNVTGGARLISGSTSSAGSFDVTGEAGAAFEVTLPQTATLQVGEGESAETMTVDNFVSDHNESEDLLTEVEGTAKSTFNVGATLNVDANQAPGTYTGEYEVTVQYL